MPVYEAVVLALQAVWSHKLRSFFTLLGIIVSVAFLIAVVAVIQGMNAYVRERLAGAIFGVTAPFVVVQDYEFAAGEALTDIDVRERRFVGVLGYDVADKLFGSPAQAVGQMIRVHGTQLAVKGVIAKKGTVLGQSWDGFVMLPLTTFEMLYGRRQTMVISVKMPTAVSVNGAMLRAEEAMRIAHRLRPSAEDDFTVDTGEGLIAFWAKLTRVIFNVVPAVVIIGVVVGGIVIMNIMLMSVTERTREIGVRKSLGASRRDIRRQFLAESMTLSLLGGMAGLAAGAGLAFLVQMVTPLPARVTLWSVGVALSLGISVGVAFGVYPAIRASRLDPIEALRYE